MAKHKPSDRVGDEMPPSSPVPRKSIPKIPTEVPGLDEILQGGLPAQKTTLIKGSAGSGKTALGMELLYRFAMKGDPVILVTFEETAEAVRQNALALGWDFPALEAAGKCFIWKAEIDRRAAASGDFNIDAMLAVIKGIADRINASRIMIDAIDVLLHVFDDPSKELNELHRLHDWLVENQFTALLTAKIFDPSGKSSHYDMLDYMADCVVLLDLRVLNQVTTRRMRVAKYRGSGFCSNEYPYLITEGGNVFMPVTAMQLSHKPLVDKVSSGHESLDEALGGGFFRSSGILIAGPTGSGKTTLAATFAQHACGRGEKVLYISFEDSQEAIISAMSSPGIDLSSAAESGLLEFRTIMPEALGPEEHMYKVLQRIEGFQPEHIIIDAISACHRMGSEQAAYDFLVRSVDACKQRGITCLMTNQLQSNDTHFNISGIGISSLVDTLIALSYVERDGQILRDLVVIKSRGTNHSNRHHLFQMTGNGIRVRPVEEPGGVTR